MTAKACASVLVALVSLAGVAIASTPRAFEFLKQTMELQPDAQHGAALYVERCTSCHEARARGRGEIPVPSLTGQREYYLIEQLVQIMMLERNVPEMHRTLAAPDVGQPQAVRDLAAYLSASARNPNVQHGSGRSVALGQRIYDRGCAQCHGRQGEGSDDEPIPGLGAQHYDYLLGQLRGFAAGHRGAADRPVIDFAGGLSGEEQAAVADYMSRLTGIASDATIQPGAK